MATSQGRPATAPLTPALNRLDFIVLVINHSVGDKIHNKDKRSELGQKAAPEQEGKRVKKSETQQKPERPIEWPYRKGQWDEVGPGNNGFKAREA